MEKLQHLPGRQHLHALRTRLVDVFQKDRERRDVVEMLVRDEDMLHPLLPPEVGEEPDRTGINGHLVVDEKRHQKLQVRWRDCGIEEFDTHGL